MRLTNTSLTLTDDLEMGANKDLKCDSIVPIDKLMNLRMLGGDDEQGFLRFARADSDIRYHQITMMNSGSSSTNNYMAFELHDGVNDGINVGLTEVMRITGDGHVGIGTNDPLCRLHITGSTLLYHNSDKTYFTRQRSNKQLQRAQGSSTTNAGIYSVQNIVTNANFVAINGNVTASDSRIKTNIIDISDNDALSILNLLQPKKYTYKDVISKGTDEVFGFIAQEVAQVIPSAVLELGEYIPNIYQLATVSGETLLFSTDLSINTITDVSSGKIKVFDAYDTTHYIDVSCATTNTMTLSNPSQITNEMQHENQVFVYGEKISDFNFLKKEMIIPIAVGAIQEIDRQLNVEKTKVSTLETTVAALEARLVALETR